MPPFPLHHPPPLHPLHIPTLHSPQTFHSPQPLKRRRFPRTPTLGHPLPPRHPRHEQPHPLPRPPRHPSPPSPPLPTAPPPLRLTSKSDVVFIFPTSSPSFSSLLHEENNSFLSLVTLHTQLNSTRRGPPSDSAFDVSRFLKSSGRGEPLWGRKTRSFCNSSQSEFTRPSYGSVLSFDADELDPENSLAGFLDRLPLSLRRWACYPMLLGRVRRNFKHVMLVDVNSVLIFNDPLGRFKNRSPDSVFVFPKRGRNSERTQSRRLVNSAVLMGGARGIRRVSQAMLVEIVRAAVHVRRKNSLSDSAILSQLASNEFVLKSVDLIVASEPLPERVRSLLARRRFRII